MVKELLFQIKKKWMAHFQLTLRKLRRLVASQSMTEESSFEVPIIINNYNRLRYLQELLDWLKETGYRNIYIIDNQSSYPPLLEFYKTCDVKLLLLKNNLGFKALWQLPLFDDIKKGYYVYTDSDVLPYANCPKNIVYQLFELSKKFPCEKIGPALSIGDLPNEYTLKDEVIQHEKKHWEFSLSQDIYDAPIDTTFALYKPFAYGAAEECKGVRVAGYFTFKHQPWHINTNAPDAEEVFYKSASIKGHTMWSEKN
jgi:hypothetical protein